MTSFLRPSLVMCTTTTRRSLVLRSLCTSPLLSSRSRMPTIVLALRYTSCANWATVSGPLSFSSSRLTSWGVVRPWLIPSRREWRSTARMIRRRERRMASFLFSLSGCLSMSVIP